MNTTTKKPTDPAEEPNVEETAAEEETAKAEEAAAEEAAAETAEETGETEPSAGSEPDEAPSELDGLQKELEASQDRYLRLMAEYDNFRKRSAREKDSIYSDARAASYTELIPVLDNFERAFQNPDVSPEDFRKGVEMTEKQLRDVFEKAGVEAFGEPGDAFDPNIHNAVMHVEDEELGDNVIAEVFQKGYKMGDRILRHAMVKVAN